MSEYVDKRQKPSDILLAGAFAAFTVDVVIYPLDTLKTRIQSKEYRKKILNPSTNAVNRALLFSGLYQGISSVILATLPASGAFFLTYESINKLLLPFNSTVPTPVLHSLASATAELVSCAILTPSEVIKQNAQVMSNSSPTKAASTTYSVVKSLRKRPFALFNGYVALAARNLPFTALQFPLFEYFRSRIHIHRGTEPENVSFQEKTMITALSAGTAGSLAAVMTTPIDVIKTRVMLETSSQEKPVVHELRVLKDMLKHEGSKALWKGALLRGIWTFIGSGLYLGMYDAGRTYLANQSF